jgi:hypothetical protein
MGMSAAGIVNVACGMDGVVRVAVATARPVNVGGLMVVTVAAVAVPVMSVFGGSRHRLRLSGSVPMAMPLMITRSAAQQWHDLTVKQPRPDKRDQRPADGFDPRFGRAHLDTGCFHD